MNRFGIGIIALAFAFAAGTAIAQDCNNNGIPDGYDIGVIPPIVFWTDISNFTLKRGSTDGSPIQTIVTGLSHPRGMAIDTVHGKVYWMNLGSGWIRRANLDGSAPQNVVAISSQAAYLAIDVAGGLLYWTEPATDKIHRSDLNGDGVVDLVTTGLSHPVSIDLDISGGKMYWSDIGTNKIQRANLDGSMIETLITGLNGPYALTLDIVAGKMYLSQTGLNKIQCANLDGSNLEDLVTGAAAAQIALDFTHGKMYWGQPSAGAIQRANLDGSHVENIVSGTGPGPWGVAIFAPPQISQDCNNDGVPDECELSGHDCNSNNELDSCDIANGTSQDCNDDGLPDECNLIEASRQLIAVSIPVNSSDGGSQPFVSGVWSVSTPPGISLNVTSGIGFLVNPAFQLGELGVLHDHTYVSPNIPDPSRAVVTYEFAQAVAVSQIEIFQHVNGITRIEGYVGDSLASLVSIGSIYGPSGDITGSLLFADGQPQVFNFNNAIAGKFFRMVIRKTSLADGYACYRAYPRDAQGTRFLGTASGILDCNNNSIPDSCDIASGASYDCNQDQIPDECQPVLDADGDGIQDGCDNCPAVANPDQANNDNDAFGNACDNCPNTFDLSQTDSDGDGLGDLCDNCPGVVNPGQEDCDNDGYGDACGCSAERGDMNGDGQVNALDTQLFVERLLRP